MPACNSVLCLIRIAVDSCWPQCMAPGALQLYRYPPYSFKALALCHEQQQFFVISIEASKLYTVALLLAFESKFAGVINSHKNVL